MKRNMVLNAIAGACFLLPSAFAQAEEKGEPATIRLTHNALRYYQSKDTTKLDDPSTAGPDNEDDKDTGITTFPPGVEIAVFARGYALYVLPWDAVSGSVLLGKAIGSDMEAGVSVSLNSNKDQDDNESTFHKFGFYYFYTRPISSSVTFEFDINPALIRAGGKQKSGTNGAIETKTEKNGYSLYLDLLGVVPIAKNFEYVFGIDFTMQKYDDKTKTNGVSGPTAKHDLSDLGLILARFRYFI